VVVLGYFPQSECKYPLLLGQQVILEKSRAVRGCSHINALGGRGATGWPWGALVGTGGNAVLLIGNFPPLGAIVVGTGKAGASIIAQQRLGLRFDETIRERSAHQVELDHFPSPFVRFAPRPQHNQEARDQAIIQLHCDIVFFGRNYVSCPHHVIWGQALWVSAPLLCGFRRGMQ